MGKEMIDLDGLELGPIEPVKQKMNKSTEARLTKQTEAAKRKRSQSKKQAKGAGAKQPCDSEEVEQCNDLQDTATNAKYSKEPQDKSPLCVDGKDFTSEGVGPDISSIGTKEGVLLRIREIALCSKDADALRACKHLLEIYEQDQDPDAKADPAQILAFIARAQLFGRDPADVLKEVQGPQRVADAVRRMLKADGVRLVLSGKTIDSGDIAQ